MSETLIPTMRLRIIRPSFDFGSVFGSSEWALQQAYNDPRTGITIWKNIEQVMLTNEMYHQERAK